MLQWPLRNACRKPSGTPQPLRLTPGLTCHAERSRDRSEAKIAAESQHPYPQRECLQAIPSATRGSKRQIVN
jgi:hypothetical protein